MDLWIRSQDKELLVNAKAFELQHYKNSPCQIFAVWNNNFMCIGTYKTKERAIEILDEIQDLYQNAYVGNSCRLVYQIPKD